jgi:succinate dehydrogenase / fumarate reductase, cytochrome b subunit
MVVSILNRFTGIGLATVGAGLFVWWLAAAATGPEAYDTFRWFIGSPFGLLIGVGLTWAMVFHTLAGIRHFVLDMGAGYELKRNKSYSVAIMFGSILLTALLWFFILGGAR